MPAATPGDAVAAVSEWAREEWAHPGKRAANLRILRALLVFAGGVVASRCYGEYLFVG